MSVVVSLRLRLALVCLIAASASGLPLVPGKSAPGTDGAYKAVFRGSLDGRGTILVSPAGVTMLGRINDQQTGRTATFLTSTLTLKNGRFTGTALAGLKKVQIVGRVEPADGKLIKAQRVFCIVRDGESYSRIVATK